MPERQLPDEVALVRRAKRGDAKAFGEIFDYYAPSVYRFLASHTNDKLDAEDLTEEVFIKLWRALPGYRERGAPFAGYLFRIARNTLTDHYRSSNHRNNTLPIDETRLPNPEADPANIVADEQERQQLQGLLNQLRPDYHMVLSLRFLSSLSTEETAAVLGRSPGATRVLQHRALAALRELLENQEHEVTVISTVDASF